MSETKQLDNEGSGEFSGDLIRRFLLGHLNTEEQTQFEERLIVDDDLGRQVRLSELELADDYAFQRLTDEEQSRFETNFLVTGDRRRELIVSRVLRDFYASPVTSKKTAPVDPRTFGERISRLFGSVGLTRPVLGPALGFAALLLFAGIVWLVIHSRRANQAFVVENVPIPQATPAVPAPTPGTIVSPTPTPKSATTPESMRPAVIASFLLLPNVLRDGGQMTRIVLPKGDRDVVRLQLSLQDSEPGTSYRAALLTAEGQYVLSSGKLKVSDPSAAAKVNFDVRAHLLKGGDYQVRLQRVTPGTTEVVARFYFRITQ